MISIHNNGNHTHDVIAVPTWEIFGMRWKGKSTRTIGVILYDRLENHYKFKFKPFLASLSKETLDDVATYIETLEYQDYKKER